MFGESISKASLRVRHDRFSSFVFVFSLLCLLLQSSLIVVSWGKLPPQVPIFYSRPWGEILLAASFWLWLLPGILLLTLIINWALVIFLVSAERFLVRVLLLFNLVISAATLYDVMKIISLLT